MGILSKFFKINGLVLVGGTALTVYQYPELRREPKQLFNAMRRGLRCVSTGSLMLYDYLSAQEINSEVHNKAANRLYQCFCKNAGPYIKIGQMVGQLNMLVPDEYCQTFEPMCMQAPRTPFPQIKKTIEKELNLKLEDVFSEFSKDPLASASLAQVHKAKLKSTGETVAVKVQHQWIKEQVPGDIRLIEVAVDIAAYFFPDFKYRWLPHEFKTRLPLELDFVLEAKNAEKCREMFKDNPYVYVPKIYHQYTKERVLVMSFEEGIPVSHVKEMYKQGIDLKYLARLISETFGAMIFEEGFVHADPHPGNLFVRKRSSDPQDIELVLLDHGIYTSLPNATRLSYNKLWRGILSQNEVMIEESANELGAGYFKMLTAIIVNRTYDEVMDKSSNKHLKQRLGDVKNNKDRTRIKMYAYEYHKDIVGVLDDMKKELLLVLKTNNYLRAIDRRLGNPNNSFYTINDITWKVYKKEVGPNVGRWIYFKESMSYHWLKFILTLYWFKLKFFSLFGIKASEEELEDFEIDYQ